jgi:hypothetical protein
LGIQAFTRNWLGIPTFIDRIFPKLNDWSLIDRRAKRLYVWSEGDKIVAARDPREHARLAREEGVSVTTLEEKDLAHVTACVKDMERYWEAVGKLWESAKQ